jgi:NAD(P)-dependent dehydrogenase (short-subunit alcohol dehydrogenase family)
MMELEGKRTLVTGAARGLGLAIATLFTERGARVALADLDRAAVDEAVAELGGGSLALQCDVTKPQDVQMAIAETVAAFGGLDVMVNNAGIEIGKPLPETSDEEFAQLMAVNVGGVFYGIKYSVPELAQTRGCIINMSSVAGLDGVPLLGVYCASKAAVIRLTQTAAIELREAGIRVNAICPSFIQTEMVDRLVAPFEAATGANFNDLAAQAQGRLGTPEEVAEMAAFLASDDASFINGSYYILDNALTASVL